METCEDIGEKLTQKLTFKPFEAQKRKDAVLDWEFWTDETMAQVCPGAVVRFGDGVVQLIGHCNENFGVCDDCTEYSYDDIVETAHINQLFEEQS